MAKGNMFLGQARGKVGDVVFYRTDGEQISRSRNRHPKNPKTDAQQIQRAISATIAKAYQAGRTIFDHSFQGLSVGAMNQRRFAKVNMGKLRNVVIEEIKEGASASECLGAVVSPQSTYPIPWVYRISEGTLVQSLFNIEKDEDPSADGPTVGFVDANTGETMAEFCTRLGLVAGEIFTICTFGWNGQNCQFNFVRLILKESAITATTAMSAATYNDFFEIDEMAMPLFSGDTVVSARIGFAQLNPNSQGSVGIIRSNLNSGLRSTSDMVTNHSLDDSVADEWPVRSSDLLLYWSPDAASLDSSLILEGGGF